MADLKREYLELQIRKYLNSNKKEDMVSLLAGVLSSEKEKCEFVTKISESTVQFCQILNCSERTAFRYAKTYNLLHLKNRLRID